MWSGHKLAEQKGSNLSNNAVPMPPIENLVFEGGGAKGAVYPGAVDALAERGLLSQVERVAGSSAGGIMAFLVALGFTPEQIKKDLNGMDFNTLMDRKDSQFWKYLGMDHVFKAIDLINKPNHGMYEGDVFLKWAKLKVFEALGDPEASFSDLHAAATKNPKLKALFLTGTNLSKKRLQEFSFQRTPDVKIAEALRVTMSFPGAFKAYPLKLNNEIHYYIDGGVISNYPMFIFDRKIHQNAQWGLNEAGSNPCTLGFRIDNEDEIRNILWNHVADDQAHLSDAVAPMPLSMKKYLHHLVESMTADAYIVNQRYSMNTIQISDLGRDTLDFNISDFEKMRMVKEGYQTTVNYLDNYRDAKAVYSLSPKQSRLEMRLDASVKDLQALRNQIMVTLRLCKRYGLPDDIPECRAARARLEAIAKHPSMQQANVGLITEQALNQLVDKIEALAQAELVLSTDNLRHIEQRRHILCLDGFGNADANFIHHIGVLGNLDILKVLAENHPEKTLYAAKYGVDKEGKNLFQLAAKHGHLEMMQYLLRLEKSQGQQNKSDRLLRKKDPLGQTPLFIAATNGQVDVVNWLLKKGLSVEHSGPAGSSALLKAASLGDRDMVAAFLLYRAAKWHKPFSLFSQDAKGRTLLHYLVEMNDENLFKIYFKQLNKQAKSYLAFTNAKDQSGDTPLHWMARFGYPMLLNVVKEIVVGKHLSGTWKIKHILGLNVRNKQNLTPTALAQASGHTALAKSLIAEGAALPLSGTDSIGSLSGGQEVKADSLECVVSLSKGPLYVNLPI